MRYVWEPEISRQYAATLPAPLRPAWGPLTAWLRRVDYRAAQRVDLFIANSQHVAARIRRFYNRDSIVVYPPVDLPPAPATGPREDFYLCVGHHVPYKRLDLALAACRQLNARLVVIGDGPDVQRLIRTRSASEGPDRTRSASEGPDRTRSASEGPDRARSGSEGPDPAVQWLGWQDPAVINDYYRRARALLFPGEEDFGIVPVEAMAHGCPVIAYGVGGATETIVDGRTGVLFTPQTAGALADAMQRAATLSFDPQAMHAHAQQFSRPRFLRELHAALANLLAH
jgi:glycosyltransferase involved in cell wall biosynthesis